MAKNKKQSATLVARAGGFVDDASGGVTPPLQPSTTFVRDEAYQLANPANSYGRDNNDQVRLAEQIIADLEGAEDCLLFASGMAAINTLFSSLKRGDCLLMQSGIYWGTTYWARKFCEAREIRLVEADSADTKGFCDLIESVKPDLIFIETPSNPWILTSDIVGISKASQRAGSIFCVDATAATPILMQPLSLGADIVVHSATKALNGHSDVLAGVLACKDASSEIWEACKIERHGAGAILSAHSAWMLIRGMRTLDVRMERMCKNALVVAEYLENHEKVEAVWYPGLKSHQGHELANSQMVSGFGYLLSFLVKGGKEAALQFCAHLEGIHRATSLGGTESLVEHRHTIEGQLTGCPENLIRLSVGIEDINDLIPELDAALEHV